MFTFDMTTNKETLDKPTGVVGQISFSRLAKLFAETGETLPSESITHFVADGQFLRFYVERD